MNILIRVDECPLKVAVQIRDAVIGKVVALGWGVEGRPIDAYVGMHQATSDIKDAIEVKATNFLRDDWELPYPKLRVVRKGCRNSGAVILFTDATTGTVVKGAGVHKIGHHSEHWASEDFEDYYGKVTLP